MAAGRRADHDAGIMLRVTDSTTDPVRPPARGHRLLAATAVALAATVVGSFTVGRATSGERATLTPNDPTPAISISFVPTDDPASCTVVGSFADLAPGDASVTYTALSAGVAFEHPDAGQVVTIGADGTAVATFAAYVRSGWSGWGDTAVQLAVGDVVSGFVEVEC